jgi:hypothetical protein
MPRRITVPNLDEYDLDLPAYGWQAPPSFWEGVQLETERLITQEIARFTDTIRSDWHLLRITWCLIRLWFS